MRAVLSSEQMVRADQYTIESLGTPAIDLMEQAARACLEHLLPHLSDRDVIVLVCGTGNNGGDGLALARLLKKRGFPVYVYALAEPDSRSPEVQTMWDRLKRVGVQPKVIEPGAIEWPSRATWIVDAIFGTGLSRPIHGPYAMLIESLNQSSCKVLAVDIPSGLMGSSGSIPGPHVHADLTVTFQSLKVVHSITPACLSCGVVEVVDIGIKFPEETQPAMYSIEIGDYQREPRHLNAHKGSYGYLGIVGGAQGMEGAAQLAARASLRFGAGKVKVISPHPNSARFHSDSVMIGSFDTTEPFDALVLGPGLSRDKDMWMKLDPWTQKEIPTVWDADGLYYLNENPLSKPNMILTPHPGEAAMLLGIHASEVQADRFGACLKLAERFPQSWILLKGFRSMIQCPQGQTLVVETGNPALATAGSGDVLAGMIGAMLAQGCSMEDSVVMATLRHGYASDRWVQSHCAHSMIAEDIIEDLKYHP